MSAFNPYSHWLNITGKEKPDTYYELLGLPHGEKNVSKIAERIESLTAAVQKAGPDGHFPEWNQILTELQIAKNCLCNPKYKAEYDAKHPVPPANSMPQGMQGMQPQNQNPQGMQPGMMPMQGMQPGMMPMQGMQPGMMPMQGMQPGMMPMQGMQPGMMPMQGMQPGMMPMQGMQPGMMPMQGMQPGMVQQMPQSAPVTPVSPVTPAAPVNVAPVAPVQVQTAPQQTNDPVFSSAAPSKSPSRSSGKSGSKHSKSKGPSPAVRNAVAIGGLIVVAVLGFMLMNKKTSPDGQDNSPIQLQVSEDGEMSVQFQNPLAANDQKAGAEAAQSAEPQKDEFSEEVIPDFDSILQAMQTGDYEKAGRLLKRAADMNISPESKERLDRLVLIQDFAYKYDTEMRSQLNKLTPPAELCSGMYGVVETKPDKLVKLRIDGKNVTFPLDKPKQGKHHLFKILYQHLYSDTLENGQMLPSLQYAAFSMVHPGGDKDGATNLLAKVAEKAQMDVDRENARAIMEEFGINGLGVMTNMAIEENAKAEAEAEKAEAAKEEAPAEEAKAETEDTDEKLASDEKVSKKKKSKKSKKDEEDEAAKAKKAEAEAKAKAEEEAAAKAKAAERHKEEWEMLTKTIRQSLAWRRIDNAKLYLEKLQKIAGTDEEKDVAARLKALTMYMETFVSWVSAEMGKFQPGATLTASGKEIGVVESGPGRLFIREEGVNKEYTVANLNPKLVDWLLGKQTKEAEDYVLYGTYLAMDPEGDRTKAKSYWTTAKSKGFDKESIDLIMEELEVPLPDVGRRPTSHGAYSKGDMGPQIIPTGDAHEKAMAKIKEEFARDYSREDSASAQEKFVEKMLKQAHDGDRPADEAYVMAEEIVRISLKHHFFKAAYQGYGVMELRFEQDTYEKRMEMIEGTDPESLKKPALNEYVQCAMYLAFDAVERKKKIDANKMLNLARKYGKGVQHNKRIRELEYTIMQMK